MTMMHGGRGIIQEGRQRIFELVRADEGAAGRAVRITQRRASYNRQGRYR